VKERVESDADHRRQWVILALLMLASLHCVRSILFVNQITPSMSFDKYETGTAYSPYQTRFMMVPLLRWAHQSTILQKIAAWQNVVAPSWERYTPEKIFCLLLFAPLLIGCGLVLTYAFRRRGGLTWWLPWAILLEILFTSFAARSSMANWYPYDFPDLAFCTVAAVAILDRRWWVLAVLMPIATFNRETTICWVILWICLVAKEQPWLRTTWESVVLLALWLAVYVPLKLRFLGNPIEEQAQRVFNLHAILLPWLWPQLASALGFLPLLMVIFQRRLSQENRRLLMGIGVCALPILWRGMWIESRIFLDFVPLIVLICAEMVERGGLLKTAIAP
jgi:hypothetical protein